VGPTTPPGQSYVIAGDADEIWQMVTAGDLNEEDIASLDPRLLPLRRPRTIDEIGRAQLSGSTLLNRTLPVNEIHHWLNLDRHFAHTLRRPDEFTPDVLLTSINIDELELHKATNLRTDRKIFCTRLRVDVYIVAFLNDTAENISATAE